MLKKRDVTNEFWVHKGDCVTKRDHKVKDGVTNLEKMIERDNVKKKKKSFIKYEPLSPYRFFPIILMIELFEREVTLSFHSAIIKRKPL